MTQPIKGILFDLGDTVLEFGHMDIPALFEAGARLTYEYLQHLNQPLPSFAKYHRRQLWAIRWSYFKSRITSREFSAIDLIGKISDNMGHRLTPEQTVELAWLWYEPLSRCSKVETNIHQTLNTLKDKGLRLGLVSNTFIPSVVLDRHLRKENLLGFFSIRIYSCDVKYRKPHPGIFRAALEQAGLEARQTMFVGDSLKADVAGANKVGMISVLKDPHNLHADASIKPHHTIRALAELPELVEMYNR
jgi:putative hydrolase of the HAD superfamily